jgi:lysophospholipase L1-like esterase
MKKLFIFILFLPLLCACTKKPLFHNSKAPDIVAFGDSLTYGLGVSRDNAYPAVLSQLAGREIVNLGVSGNTAQQGAMRMHDIGKSMPCMVLIEFGGNDLLQNRPMEETRKALEEIIDYVHGLNAMAVIVDTGGNYQMSRYTKMMKKLAKKKRALFIPGIMDGIFSDKSLKSDILHPNEKGYEIIANKVYEAIKPYLKNQEDKK